MRGEAGLREGKTGKIPTCVVCIWCVRAHTCHLLAHFSPKQNTLGFFFFFYESRLKKKEIWLGWSLTVLAFRAFYISNFKNLPRNSDFFTKLKPERSRESGRQPPNCDFIHPSFPLHPPSELSFPPSFPVPRLCFPCCPRLPFTIPALRPSTTHFISFSVGKCNQIRNP